MGAERISFELKRQFNIKCAISTVGAILKRSGLITEFYAERLTKKHLRRYGRPFPGYLQMDFKYVPYRIETKQLYQLSVIDHHSSWRFIRIYDNRSLKTVVEFLEELFFNCPFAIMQIQTDNAAEFTDKYSSSRGRAATGWHAFDKWCEARDIEHKLIPIGEKEINGKLKGHTAPMIASSSRRESEHKPWMKSEKKSQITIIIGRTESHESASLADSNGGPEDRRSPRLRLRAGAFNGLQRQTDGNY